jgi:hypothetical protein
VTLNAEGVRLLRQDKGSGRRAAVTRAVEAAGGKVEAFYSRMARTTPSS